MIAVERLVRRIRFKENDNNEIRYSDYDILQAINECVGYVNQEYAVRSADFLEKIVRIDEPESEGTELPADFLTLLSVCRARDGYIMHPVPAAEHIGHDGFKVVDNRLYVHEAVVLAYKRCIGSVTAMEDMVELPAVFFEAVVKFTIMILNNAEKDVLMKAVTDLLSSIVPARKYVNMKRKMPFYC